MVYKASDESVFNMALAYLKRIDKLLNYCSYYSMQRDIQNWFDTIMALYREISIKISDEEGKDIVGERVTIIDSKICEPKNATVSNINYLMNNKRSMILRRKEILFYLHHLEIIIRKIMQKRGMLLPSKDDISVAITRR